MNIEPLRLEAGKAGGDGLEALAHEVVQPLLQAEIGEIVGDQLVAQKGRELFVLLQEGVLEVGAKDMMAVVDAIDDGGELALHSTAHAGCLCIALGISTAPGAASTTPGNSASRPSPVFFDGTAIVLVDLRIEELARLRLEPFVRALVGSH